MSFFGKARINIFFLALILLVGSVFLAFSAEEENKKDKSIVSLGYLYSNWSMDELYIQEDIDFEPKYGTAVFDFEYSATEKFGFGVSFRMSQVDQDWKGIDQEQRDYLQSNLKVARGGSQFATWEGYENEFAGWVADSSEYESFLDSFFGNYENTTTRNSGELFARYKINDYIRVYLGAYYLRYDYYSFFEYRGWKNIVLRIADSDFFANNIGYYERQNRFGGPKLSLRGTVPIGEHTGFYGDMKVAYAQMWRMRSTYPLKSQLFFENPKYKGKTILPFERPVDYLVKFEIERPGNKQAYQIEGAVGFIYKFEALHPKLPIVISAYYELCKIYLFDYTGDAYVKDIVFGDDPRETSHNFVFNIGYEW